MNLVDAVRGALDRRRALALPPHTDVLRLVDDKADGAPHLLVDRYGHVARLELYASAWPSGIDDIARAIVDATGVAVVVGLLRPHGKRAQVRALVGTAPPAHVVHEDGVRLLVRTADEDAAGAGVFVDHRHGRRAVRDLARGQVVLNLFAHAGAFGAAAAVGGAARVDHVDAARKCAQWAAVNLALNGFDPKGHRFLVDDAIKVLARAARRDPGYGVVIVDPPTTALRPDGSRFIVSRDLGTLAADAGRALIAGGALVLSCNDRELGVDDVARIGREGVSSAGHRVARVDEIPLPDDMPSGKDQRLRPMRGVVVVTASR